MISKRLKEVIRDVPDFPKPGILFKDITPILLNPQLTRDIVNEMVKHFKDLNLDAIVGIESRGFVLGAALSQELDIPFVMIRKKGAKYPGKLLEESYELEYGTDTLTLQEGILGHTSRVLIADDLVATGGSMNASKLLCEQTGAIVLGGVTIVNLKYLNGEEMELLSSVEIEQ